MLSRYFLLIVTNSTYIVTNSTYVMCCEIKRIPRSFEPFFVLLDLNYICMFLLYLEPSLCIYTSKFVSLDESYHEKLVMGIRHRTLILSTNNPFSDSRMSQEFHSLSLVSHIFAHPILAIECIHSDLS